MSLPTERYALLIRQLGAELGNVRGWKKRVAERLGVHPSYVSRILSGEKLTIGPDVIDRACERLGLGADFFFVEQSAPPDYHDFLDAEREEVARETAREAIREEAETWREAHAAAFAFLRTATTDLSPEGSVPDAARLLEVVRRIPLVRAAMDLDRALARSDADAAREHGFSLAGTVVVDAHARETPSEIAKRLMRDLREGLERQIEERDASKRSK